MAKVLPVITISYHYQQFVNEFKQQQIACLLPALLKEKIALTID